LFSLILVLPMRLFKYSWAFAFEEREILLIMFWYNTRYLPDPCRVRSRTNPWGTFGSWMNQQQFESATTVLAVKVFWGLEAKLVELEMNLLTFDTMFSGGETLWVGEELEICKIYWKLFCFTFSVNWIFQLCVYFLDFLVTQTDAYIVCTGIWNQY
jgi:hypothetical protein